MNPDALNTIPTSMIANAQDLATLCEHLRETGSFALDMEFASESVYYPRLHLVQVATRSRAALVDPLAVDDMTALWEIVADPTVIKITHAGRQDAEIAYQQGGRAPKTWHDTQVAAALLGLGEQIGYANLLQRLSGIRLKKTERVTDWSQRPLSDPQKEYAYNDVLYLLGIYDALEKDLKERRRFDWFLEELSYYEEESTYLKKPEEMWKRVSGKQSLGRQGLAILRELAAWREREARERDRPRGRIVADDVLVELAARRPQHVKDIKPLRRVHPRLLASSGEALVRAVQLGLEAPKETWPKSLKGLPENPSLQLSGYLMDALLRLRAKENNIAPSYLANQRALRQLADYLAGRLENGNIPPLLSGWRKDLVGDDLVKLFDGKLKLSIDPETHHPVVSS